MPDPRPDPRQLQPNVSAPSAGHPIADFVAAQSPTLIGIVCAVGAVITFSTQDMAVKWLSGDYPLHEIILFRATVAMILTLSIFVPLEGGYRNLRTRRLPLHLLRGLAVVIANMTFFTGLASLPLGEATAIFFRRTPVHHRPVGPAAQGVGRSAPLARRRHRPHRRHRHAAPRQRVPSRPPPCSLWPRPSPTPCCRS